MESRQAAPAAGVATPVTAAASSRPRDLAASALVLGVATAAWFGWGSSGAPHLRLWFLIGVGLGLALAVTAGVLRRRMPGQGSHAGPDRRAVQRTYNIAVIAEVALIVAGNVTLGLIGQGQYAICWTYAVMSVHFLPLARVYGIRMLRVSAVVGLLVAAVGAALGIANIASPIAVTGGVGALALLLSGAVQLRQALAALPRTTAT